MDLFAWIGIIIIAVILGGLAEMLTKSHLPYGWLGNIVAAFVGGFIGQLLLGQWGPQIFGWYLIQTIIGAIIVISLYIWIVNTFVKSRRSTM